VIPKKVTGCIIINERNYKTCNPTAHMITQYIINNDAQHTYIQYTCMIAYMYIGCMFKLFWNIVRTWCARPLKSYIIVPIYILCRDELIMFFRIMSEVPMERTSVSRRSSSLYPSNTG
jgi:hypothetical protein